MHMVKKKLKARCRKYKTKDSLVKRNKSWKSHKEKKGDHGEKLMAMECRQDCVKCQKEKEKTPVS